MYSSALQEQQADFANGVHMYVLEYLKAGESYRWCYWDFGLSFYSYTLQHVYSRMTRAGELAAVVGFASYSGSKTHNVIDPTIRLHVRQRTTGSEAGPESGGEGAQVALRCHLCAVPPRQWWPGSARTSIWERLRRQATL